MKKVYSTGLCAALLMVSACDGSLFGGGADCGSDDTQRVIDELLKEELEFAVQATLDSQKELGSYDATELENAVDRIRLRLSDVRTSQDSSGSARLSCRATLSIDFPTAIQKKANEARSYAEMGSVRELANRFKLKRRSGNFTSDFDYFVQPTDDGSKLFAEFDDDTASLEFMSEVLASYLLADEIRAERVEVDREEAEARREELEEKRAKETAEREEKEAFEAEGAAALNAAKVERELASQEIQGVWKAMGKVHQDAIDELHSAWVKQMNARCAANAAGTDTRASMREARELQCQTGMVKSCARTLRRNINSRSTRTNYCRL